MRILYWTESFWPRIGGSEVAAATLLTEMRKRGHALEVITRQWSIDQPTRDEWQGFTVHRVPFNDETFLKLDLHEILPLRQRVATIKRNFKADVVQVGLTGPSLFLHNFTAGQFPAPTVITTHVVPVDTEYGVNKPVQEAFKAAAHVVAVSKAVANKMLQKQPDLAGRISVIYNALPEPEAARCPVPFDPPTLLCVGRVTEQKGFDTAIKAMRHVCEAFPNARLLIAGDGDATDALRQLAEQTGISANVQFLGWQSPEQVTALIDAATMVLMPSRWEPFGLVALQAAQRGRVCLASNVDGLPEVVLNCETGMLLPVDDADSWAVVITGWLRNPATIQTLGAQARAHALESFGLDRHIDAYEALYRRLTGNTEAMA